MAGPLACGVRSRFPQCLVVDAAFGAAAAAAPSFAASSPDSFSSLPRRRFIASVLAGRLEYVLRTLTSVEEDARSAREGALLVFARGAELEADLSDVTGLCFRLGAAFGGGATKRLLTVEVELERLRNGRLLGRCGGGGRRAGGSGCDKGTKSSSSSNVRMPCRARVDSVSCKSTSSCIVSRRLNRILHIGHSFLHIRVYLSRHAEQ